MSHSSFEVPSIPYKHKIHSIKYSIFKYFLNFKLVFCQVDWLQKAKCPHSSLIGKIMEVCNDYTGYMTHLYGDMQTVGISDLGAFEALKKS